MDTMPWNGTKKYNHSKNSNLLITAYSMDTTFKLEDNLSMNMIRKVVPWKIPIIQRIKQNMNRKINDHMNRYKNLERQSLSKVKMGEGSAICKTLQQ